MVICLERGADLHMTQLMPLPLTVSCFSKIQFGFTFLVPAHLGRPRQRVCVCVCVSNRGVRDGNMSVDCGGVNCLSQGPALARLQLAECRAANCAVPVVTCLVNSTYGVSECGPDSPLN